jgi:hypothetical protein
MLGVSQKYKAIDIFFFVLQDNRGVSEILIRGPLRSASTSCSLSAEVPGMRPETALPTHQRTRTNKKSPPSCPARLYILLVSIPDRKIGPAVCELVKLSNKNSLFELGIREN